MSKDLYYEPMSNKTFNLIKKEAIKIWKAYDDTYDYTSIKINKIKDLKNIEDNGMYIIAMFDHKNQAKLQSALTVKANDEINKRFKGWNELY